MKTRGRKGVFSRLPEELVGEILDYADNNSVFGASKKYGSELGMSPYTLQNALISYRTKHSKTDSEGELNSDDVSLLERLKKGEIGFEQIQRELAVRAIEKILKNPTSVSVRDWLSSEMIKVKQEETNDKYKGMERFINRFFADFQWDKCPHCSKSLAYESTPSSD